MFGFLNINKPKGKTSHDIVNILRRKLNTRKIGHLGTLDPFATGVLPVAVGKFTKLIKYITNDIKAYEAEIVFGIKTDSKDITGKLLEKVDINSSIENIDFFSILKEFIGKSKQIPPMLSAKKVNGKKLYELFRKGIEIERKPIDIEIYDIKFLKLEIKSKNELNIENNDIYYELPEKVYILKYYAKVSKGTYIRTLTEDICSKIGVIGTTLALNRVQAGNFFIENSIDLEFVDKNIEFIKEKDILEYKSIIISDSNRKRALNGNFIKLLDVKKYNHLEKVLVYDVNNIFLGLGFIDKNRLILKMERVLVNADN